MMDRDLMFYQDFDDYTPYFDKSPDYIQLRKRFSNPDLYLTDTDKKNLKSPKIVTEIINQLPIYLYDRESCSDFFIGILEQDFIDEVLSQDREIVSQIATQIISDYLNIPKMWTDEDEIEVLNTNLYEVETAMKIFCLQPDIQDGRITSAFEKALKENLFMTQLRYNADFISEKNILEIMTKNGLNTNIFRSKDVQKLFIKKLKSIRGEELNAVGGSEEEQAGTINLAKLILGENTEKVRDIFVNQLPFLIIYPKGIWSLLSIKKIIPYKEAQDTYKFDFTEEEYNTAKKNVEEAIQKANDVYKKNNGHIHDWQVKIDTYFPEFMNK